jgi:hypothetical protein
MEAHGKSCMKNTRLMRFIEINRNSFQESDDCRKSTVRRNVVGLLNVESGDTLVKNYALRSIIMELVSLPAKDMMK